MTLTLWSVKFLEHGERWIFLTVGARTAADAFAIVMASNPMLTNVIKMEITEAGTVANWPEPQEATNASL